MSLRLEVMVRGRRLPHVDLQPGNRMALGRDPECHVVLDDPHLSRRQLTLVASESGAVEFVALGGKNPMLFRGHAVDRATLVAGQEIRVGETVLLVRGSGGQRAVPEVQKSIEPEAGWVFLDAQDSDSWWSESEFSGGSNDESLARAAEHLEGLFALSRAVARQAGTDALLESLMDVVFETLPVTRAFLELGDANEGRFDVVKLRVRDSSETSIAMSQAVLDEIRRGTKGLLVPRVQEVFDPERHPSVATLGIQAFMAVPLTAGARTLGVLYADQLGEDRRFDRGDLRYLQAVAHLTASAIDRLADRESLEIRAPGLERSGRFIATSLVMRDLLKEARRAAEETLPLLISGESGTGKRKLARLVHDESSRSSGPFVEYRGGLDEPDPLARELFGQVGIEPHGAEVVRPGLLHRANGGTFYLAELERMPLVVQVRLMEIIESGRLRPEGARISTPVDVRWILGSKQNPTGLLQRGALRDDLYFEITRRHLQVPPLRKRIEDIQAMLEDRLPHGLVCPEPVRRALESYGWPGNVREFSSVLERAMSRATGGRLLLRDLPVEVAREGRRPVLDVALKTLAEMEIEHIRRVLRRVDGNKKRAAQILGISRETLYKKLRDAQ
ncbi:MAG: sigma 54-interacting transcriptional regulator [Planctomycetes bacterium]|nr:sigma 54-interacting transcriptional regulator [Planctomycetota bacterium]